MSAKVRRAGMLEVEPQSVGLQNFTRRGRKATLFVPVSIGEQGYSDDPPTADFTEWNR